MSPLLGARYALKGIWIAAIAGVLLLILGFGVYQYTMRHGFQLLFWEHEGEIAKIDRLEGEIKALVDGQAEAERLQKALNDAKEQTYTDIAERIDDAQDNAQGAALSAADAFIAANRVRPEADRCPPGQAGGPAQGEGAGVSATVPASPVVAVSDADVRACSAVAAYAVGAHNWAVELDNTN
jgi:hypothetical protein